MKKKGIHYLIILVAVIIVNFFLPRMLPGSPLRSLIGENPGDLTAAEKMGILEAYHLNEPLPKQFVYYIKDLFTLNWGDSYVKRRPIRELVFSKMIWTLLLAGSSMILSTLLGTALGVWSAFRRKHGRDLPIILAATISGAIPSFWIGIILLAVFGVRFKWFPLYGAYSMWKNYHGISYVWDVLRHLTLPAATLTITSLMSFFTVSRVSTLRVIQEDYIKMAKMRGISSGRILLWYVIRNMMIPVFTLFMLDIGYLLSGSVLVETVFSYPGLGSLMQEAVVARDYPLMQYTFVLSAVVTVLALFAADLLYHKINPEMEVSDE